MPSEALLANDQEAGLVCHSLTVSELRRLSVSQPVYTTLVPTKVASSSDKVSFGSLSEQCYKSQGEEH